MNSTESEQRTSSKDVSNWRLWKATGDLQVWGHDSCTYNKYETKMPKYNGIKLMTTNVAKAKKAAGNKDINDFENHDGAYLSSNGMVKITLNHLVGLNPVILKKFLEENRQYLEEGVTDEMIHNASRTDMIKMAWKAPRLLWGRTDPEDEDSEAQECLSWIDVEEMAAAEEKKKKTAMKKAGNVTGQKRKVAP